MWLVELELSETDVKYELTQQPCTAPLLPASHHCGGENLISRVSSSGRKLNISLTLLANDFHKTQINQEILHCFSSFIQE